MTGGTREPGEKYSEGEICQVSAKAEIDGGEDGENGDDKFRCEHTLPGAHSLLAESSVGRTVLGSICL